jgi:hypothetical protein
MSVAKPPAHVLWDLINSFRTTQALYVVASLGVADVLAEGPLDASTIAARVGADAAMLARVMRALASMGVFESRDDGRFALTPVGDALRRDAPVSARAMAVFTAAPWHWKMWSGMLEAVRTGKTASEVTMQTSVFEYLSAHPEDGASFDAAMISLSQMTNTAVLSAYDFTHARRVVDVGGGHGGLLSAALMAHPELRGTLFDQPDVLEGARARLAPLALLDRCELVGGDFFEAIPAGGDVYVMKSILHDWDDARAGSILRACRRAMSPSARLLLIEMIVPAGDAPHASKMLDLEMILFGGRERTASEYRALLEASGFALARSIATSAPHSVLEAVPA